MYINDEFKSFNSDDQIGQTPLCIAAYHGHEAIVEYFIQAGADIDGKFAFSKMSDDVVNSKDNWKVYWKVCDCTTSLPILN